jgi:hypothetical protein
MCIIVAPLLVGLAAAVSPKTVFVSTGIKHLYAISWLFGYPTSIFLYWLFNLVSPDKASHVLKTISGLPEVLDAEDGESLHSIAVDLPQGKASEKVMTSSVTEF